MTERTVDETRSRENADSMAEARKLLAGKFSTTVFTIDAIADGEECGFAVSWRGKPLESKVRALLNSVDLRGADFIFYRRGVDPALSDADKREMLVMLEWELQQDLAVARRNYTELTDRLAQVQAELDALPGQVPS
jgi:hypothetical protein